MPSFKKPRRYWPIMAAGVSIYSFYFDHFKPLPKPVSHISDKPRNVVVVGGGLVGLSTAYFLSQNEANKVRVLTESRELIERSIGGNGTIISPSYSVPMIYVSVYEILRGIFRADTPNSVSVFDAVRHPGIYRFLRFWMSPLTWRGGSQPKTSTMLQLQAENDLLLQNSGLVEKSNGTFFELNTLPEGFDK